MIQCVQYLFYPYAHSNFVYNSNFSEYLKLILLANNFEDSLVMTILKYYHYYAYLKLMWYFMSITLKQKQINKWRKVATNELF